MLTVLTWSRGLFLEPFSSAEQQPTKKKSDTQYEELYKSNITLQCIKPHSAQWWSVLKQQPGSVMISYHVDVMKSWNIILSCVTGHKQISPFQWPFILVELLKRTLQVLMYNMFTIFCSKWTHGSNYATSFDLMREDLSCIFACSRQAQNECNQTQQRCHACTLHV